MAVWFVSIDSRRPSRRPVSRGSAARSGSREGQRKAICSEPPSCKRLVASRSNHLSFLRQCHAGHCVGDVRERFTARAEQFISVFIEKLIDGTHPHRGRDGRWKMTDLCQSGDQFVATRDTTDGGIIEIDDSQFPGPLGGTTHQHVVRCQIASIESLREHLVKSGSDPATETKLIAGAPTVMTAACHPVMNRFTGSPRTDQHRLFSGGVEHPGNRQRQTDA